VVKIEDSFFLHSSDFAFVVVGESTSAAVSGCAFVFTWGVKRTAGAVTVADCSTNNATFEVDGDVATERVVLGACAALARLDAFPFCGVDPAPSGRET
jgi:hypothetical protein